ncbi:TetR/AcrR family transcriptional regulator [Nonomuraea ferruginea]|uniref:TetR/AcrR family transcriptional regulator n=1 Tax=Nonomuraea ferruginea TaxID=46174 RepID=A0ABT4TD36_9ACTN|nr:TetR/AcrR family transcriptional regulator [Nonomuraea ferruginea]MDA0647417.1 TetR/AcrR family transcriptional regulator [Nonomuraea ferruginea]
MSDSSRRPAGAAVLRQEVTGAIIEAALAELTDHGYARMSMDAVARRAGVGKAAIYRRWSSKEPLVLDLLTELADQAVPLPDTGTLHEDVAGFVRHTSALRADDRAMRILTDLTAEATRNPRLATAMHTTAELPRRAAATELLQRAVDRGELPADLDLDLATDCLIGLAYLRPRTPWQPSEPLDPGVLARLVEVILAALTACRG